MIDKIDIDFLILTDYDPKLIIVGDISKWYNAENQPATICITPPGGISSINNTFVKHTFFFRYNYFLFCIILINLFFTTPLYKYYSN